VLVGASQPGQLLPELEDNLLPIRQRRYVITTDSERELTVYLNPAKRLTLTAANQLWVADLTYIQLNHEFLYRLSHLRGSRHYPRSSVFIRG
jgi:hypothetical protein